MIKNMSFDEAYNTQKALYNMLPVVNAFTVTTMKKIHHLAKVEEFRNLLNKLEEIHPSYDPEYNSAFYRYKSNVYGKTGTKQDWDRMLNFCKIDLISSIKSHLNLLEEVKKESLSA